MPDDNKALKTASLAAVGTGLGAGCAMAGTTPVHLHRAGIAGPLNNFSYGATNAWKHHASLGGILGGGFAAMFGHGTMVALATAGSVAVAAAPFVLGAGAAVFAGYGLVKLHEAITD